MRILVAPGLGTGRVVPLAAVASELAARGHTIYFHAGPEAGPLCRRQGFRYVPMPARDAAARTFSSRTAGGFIRVLSGLAARVAGDLSRVVVRERIDGFLTDALHLGAGLVAEKAGTRWLSVATSPMVLHPIARQGVQAMLPTDRLRQRLGLRPSRRNSLQQGWSSQGTVLPWTPAFDLGRPPPRALHVGPLVTSGRAEPAAPPWLRSLGRRRPLVGVSLSTWPLKSLQQVMGRVLEQVVEALSELRVDAVLTVPSGVEERLRKTPNIRVARFLPHGALLERSSVWVSHGGWGALSRTFLAGVPPLVVPFAFDQPINAELCEAQGVSLSLPAEEVTAPVVLDRLSRLLAADSPQRLAMQRLSEELARQPAAAKAAADAFLAL